MYIYKKQCDEDFYLGLIRFTQQQCQYYLPFQPQYNCSHGPPQYYSMKQNYFQNFNQINENDGYKTPKRKKSFQAYKEFSGTNSPSPSPTINFIIIILFFNENYYNNDNYPQNQN